MTTVITFISQYDPISKDKNDKVNDGAALHILRQELPDTIIAIYSEEMLKKRENFEQAVAYLYTKKQKNHPTIQNIEISNDDIYRFDKMYEKLETILDQAKPDENWILNITSGTPQCQSALYAINYVKNYNTKLARVDSPKQGSNHEIKPFEAKELKECLIVNEDNRAESRLHIEIGSKLKKHLLQRQYQQFIETYSYEAAKAILENNSAIISDKAKRKESIKILKDLTEVFQAQKLSEDIEKSLGNGNDAKALNCLLMIDVHEKRGDLADVLVKSKSLAEFVLHHYINQEYEKKGKKLICDNNGFAKLNKKHEDCTAIVKEIKKKKKFGDSVTLNIFHFSDIIAYYDKKSQLLKYVKPIKDINDERNKVAHNLSELDKNKIKKDTLERLVDSLRHLIESIYQIDKKYFSYYDEKNKKLIELFQ